MPRCHLAKDRKYRNQRLSGLTRFRYGGLKPLIPSPCNGGSPSDPTCVTFGPAAPGSIRQLFPAPAFTVPGSLIPEVMRLLAPFIALCATIRL